MNLPVSTPLRFLGLGWFSLVMGVGGLSLAWQRAVPVLGELAGAVSMALSGLAGVIALVLAGASLLRWRRYPQALAEDLRHPVRHGFAATLPIGLLLLVTAATAITGPSALLKALWMAASVWQAWVTLWVLRRWLQPAKDGGLAWPVFNPILILPVVGNVVPPLAGPSLGLGPWAAAQFGLGLFLWPVVIALLAARIAVNGLWPERLLPTTFITVSPPSVVGLSLLQLGAPDAMAWGAWGIALFFAAWSSGVLRRMFAQPFSLTFWALSFPMAAFSALTLRLAQDGPAWFQAVAMILLALTSFIVVALVLATFRGLRDRTLLAPEPVAALVPGAGA